MKQIIRTDLLGMWHAIGSYPPGDILVVYEKEWGNYLIIDLESNRVNKCFDSMECGDPIPELVRELDHYRR